MSYPVEMLPRVAAALALLVIAVPASTDAIKVLWMGSQGAPTAVPAARGSSGKTTDKLLQDAIRNIDQLTQVARSLSDDKLAQMTRPEPTGGDKSLGLTASGMCEVLVTCVMDQTKPGEKVVMVGSDPSLGAWSVDKALELKTSAADFPQWKGKLVMKLASAAEFKFALKTKEGNAQWENGGNRKLVTGNGGMSLEATWGRGGEKVTKAVDDKPTAAKPAQAPVAAASTARETPAAASSVSPVTRLHLRIKCRTSPGESVSVCGSLPAMGAWDVKKAMPLATSADDYPYWSGVLELKIDSLPRDFKYKYVVVSKDSQFWEDQIADRELAPEASSRGLLSPNTDSHVDDGTFNKLQRVCTYVRDGKERLQAAPRQDAKQSQASAAVPEGMQLVSMEQVREWERRLAELEEECEGLRERAREAEATVDTLNRDLEEERKQNEEILHQMAFVEELISRVKKIENQVTSLESTREVLLTRSESLTNLQDKGIESRKPDEQGRMVNSIELGIAGVQEMLARLDQQIPADG